MAAVIKHPKDFWTGIIYVGIGGATILIGQGYTMGSALRMGPAYFPTILGGLLTLIGLAALVRSFFKDGEPIAPFAWKEVILVLASVILFGFLARTAGLAPTLILLVLLSAYGSAKFKWGPAIILAIGMTVFSILVFVIALGVPLPILGTWFGN